MSSAVVAAAAGKCRVAIVYYSMYGHIATMAKSVVKGVEAAGCEAKVFQVPETLSATVLEKMHAPPKDSAVPVLTDASELEAFDGIIFGAPTRYGMICAQMKAFFDTTGGLWMKGAFVGKPTSLFFSTGTPGGGQETTALTCMTQFVHHGMIYVPIGYSDPRVTSFDEIHGSSPYGAGTYAGAKGDRQPTELELGIAEHQGKHVASIAAALKRGKAAK